MALKSSEDNTATAADALIKKCDELEKVTNLDDLTTGIDSLLKISDRLESELDEEAEESRSYIAFRLTLPQLVGLNNLLAHSIEGDGIFILNSLDEKPKQALEYLHKRLPEIQEELEEQMKS